MVLLLALVVAARAADEDEAAWGYFGATGPQHWGGLSEAFLACREGKYQSPIDVVDAIDAALATLQFSYGGSTTAISNSGHTIQVDVGPGNTLEVGGQRFDLVQFHMHSPSEHHIEGESFPLEVHFVHRDEHGQLAVVAVMFRLGAENPALVLLGASAPSEVGQTRPFAAPLAELVLLPEERSYYRYSGSLTTPPCTEGVIWLVLKEPRTTSKQRVTRFVELIGENARPLQPLTGRSILH